MEIDNNKAERMRLDRIQSIFKMHELGETNRDIAKLCKCSASTVSDTLNKYRHDEEIVWSALSCYEKAKYVWDRQKAASRAKNRVHGHIRDVEIEEYVERSLVVQGYSPEIISNEMKKELGKGVSTSTIYRYVNTERQSLRRYLHEKGKPRRARICHRRGRFKRQEKVEKTYIDQRPERINSRREFGHWECDLIIGPKSGTGYVILSLLERKSRFKKYIRLPDAKAETVLARLLAFFLTLPEKMRKSITFDNGSEFTIFVMNKLKKQFNSLKIYYTETYSPQQKGACEHSNGRFRRYFPKKTDFGFVDKVRIRRAEDKLNNRPMKLHRFKTPREIFDAALEAINQDVTLDNLKAA